MTTDFRFKSNLCPKAEFKTFSVVAEYLQISKIRIEKGITDLKVTTAIHKSKYCLDIGI